jgi:hypothetical protein
MPIHLEPEPGTPRTLLVVKSMLAIDNFVNAITGQYYNRSIL